MSGAGSVEGHESEVEIVRAGSGAGFSLKSGDEIIVLNTSGTQVVDFWCVSPGDSPEFLSMEHSREVLGKIYYEPGDVLLSNRYTPMIAYLADTSGGKHDTLIAACNPDMYQRFGCDNDHPSCAGNFHAALASAGIRLPIVPQPWNLFMRARVSEAGAIHYERPPYMPGSFVQLKLLTDAVIAVSACPDDCYPTNGGDGTPRDFSVLLRRQDA